MTDRAPCHHADPLRLLVQRRRVRLRSHGAGCVLAGASHVGATGYSHGVLVHDVSGAVSNLRGLANTNGLGQVACGTTLNTCVTIGSAIKP